MKTELQTVRGELLHVARLPQSANGNARFRFEVGELPLRTGVDSSLADDVKNIMARVGPHFVECTFKPVRGHLTIQSIKKV
jgi:hypothetical protein